MAIMVMVAIYGNNKKPGQHCIENRESAQESCSEMPATFFFIMRRCVGNPEEVQEIWNGSSYISVKGPPTQPSIITVYQMPRVNFS